MRLFYIFLFFITCNFINAQIVNIPDANFKNALINTNCVDTNGDDIGDSDADFNDDGEIQVAEAESVLWLNVAGENISSLEGIQSFINLEELIIFDNDLTNLDITQNISLTRLSCWINQLSSLDVTQNSNLESLNCDSNDLSNLDVTQNLNLTTLLCYNNQLSSLDISQNVNLEGLSCEDNLLDNLDVTQNLSLKELWCSNNLLTSLYINNGNNHNMQTMICTDNPDLFCIQVDDETATYPVCGGFPLEGWCKDTWSSYSEKCIFGLTDFENISINLYPNPVNNVMTISLSQGQLLSVQVYNIEGKKVFTQNGNNQQLNLERLDAGMYFLKIITDAGTATKKIIKQ